MGGMTVNSFLMQLQANLCGMEVSLPAQTEPSYGAACMALSGIDTGFRIEDLKAINPPVKTYHPDMKEEERSKLIGNWLKAVERTLDWHPQE